MVPIFSHGPVPYRGLIEGYKPNLSFQKGSQADLWTPGRHCVLLNLGWAAAVAESKEGTNWELEERTREREESCCQQALMVNRCGGTPSLPLSLQSCIHTPTHPHTHTHTYCNTHWRGGEAKQSFGVNSWDGCDSCGSFCTERPKLEKTKKDFQMKSSKHSLYGRVFFTRWFCRNATLTEARVSYNSGLQAWFILFPCGT